MLDDRPSRIALALSLLLHAALLTPVRDYLGLAAEPAPVPVETAAEEPIAFRFVDSQPVEAEAPDAPSENLSTTDARAAQPDAPAELPEGAAYSPGRAPVPTTPRAAGTPAAGERGAAERTEPAADPAASRPAPETDDAPPAGAATEDPRLAAAFANPRLRAGRAEPPGAAALPAPEVDQRLTRAARGSDFSLNTTAWRWGPYMERLKRRVEAHIAPPAAFYYGTAAWVTRVRFRIAPDGRLAEVRLLDHRGVTNLQYVATDAIEGAADYEPLPPDFPEPYLEVTANFYFNVRTEP